MKKKSGLSIEISEKKIGKSMWLTYKVEIICCVLLAIGIGAKILYGFLVPFDISPHDLGYVSDWKTVEYGHLGYIQYMYQYKQLPDFSPLTMRQFYHPPLFYIISAIVMRVAFYFTTNVRIAFEVIQFTITLYASVATIFLYLIAKKIGIKGKYLIFVTMFFSFTPVFFILGVTLNNDMLMVLLSIMAIYFTVCWIESHSCKAIVGTAFSMGLAMMTKSSAALIAPAIGLVFLCELIKNKKIRMSIIKQLVIFGVICVPIGMFWMVRNKILFDVPFNYVLKISKNSPISVINASLMDRIGFPKKTQIFGYKINIKKPYDYANIWGQTMLTMVFDEGILKINTIIEKILGITMMWSSAVIYGISIISTIRGLFVKRIELNKRILFTGSFIIIFASYINFCFKYPQVCTMNFRYVVMSLVSAVMMYGMLAGKEKVETGKSGKYKVINIINLIMKMCIIVTSVSSIVLFITCA